MSAKTIAEMQEELEKAGIDWCVRYLEWEPISEPQKEIAITENYKRYQRERQHEAMRELLEQMVNGYVWNDVDYDRNPEGNLQQWLHTAARLLKGEVD